MKYVFGDNIIPKPDVLEEENIENVLGNVTSSQSSLDTDVISSMFMGSYLWDIVFLFKLVLTLMLFLFHLFTGQ